MFPVLQKTSFTGLAEKSQAKYIDRTITGIVKLKKGTDEQKTAIVDAIVTSAINQIKGSDDVPALLASWQDNRAVQITEIINKKLENEKGG